MNRCFLSGEIVSDIEFKFIIESKNYSIVTFQIKLLDTSIVKLEAYNEISDYCYSQLKPNDVIFLEGSIQSNLNIKILQINKI